MPDLSACPDAAELQQFAAGAVAPPRAEEVRRHLEQCLRCRTNARRLSTGETVPEARPAVAPDPEPVYDTPPSPPGPAALKPGGSSEAPYDFLGPAQEPGELGRLGEYRVLKVLGEGGMGIVFLAEDMQLKRLVALKTMRPEVAGAAARARFLREARAMAAVKHDHIATVHHVGEERGVPFYAMELLEGASLEARLKREGILSPTEVLRIGREVAAGLAAAHERGLIHRDIKPSNVWLEARPGEPGASATGGRVKLLDFGLARAATATDVHLTGTGVIVGTPTYMAPEQARGEPVDARSDLFSLGCVLYRMTTGAVPFAGKDVMSVLLALATTQPKPARELSPAAPVALSDLILRLLAKDPARRPASARDVAQELGSIEEAARRGLDKPEAPPEKPRRWRFGLVCALAAALLAPAAWVFGPSVIRLATNRGGPVSSATDRDADGTAARPDGNGELAAEPLLLDVPVVEAVLGDGRLRHWREVTALAFSRDGKLLATAGIDATARVWDPATGQEVVALNGRMADVLAVAFHPTRKLLATGSEDGPARLWDLETGTAILTVPMGGWVNSVAFSPDGRLLAAMAGKTALKVVEVETGKELYALPGGNPQGTDFADRENITGAVAFRPDGTLLACRADEGVKLLDPLTGKQQQVFNDPGRVSCLAWSPDGNVLATGTMHRPAVKVLDAGTGQVRQTFGPDPRDESVNVLTLAFSPEGRTLAAVLGVSSPLTGNVRGWVQQWDVATGRQEPSLRSPVPNQRLYALAFSPDGRTLVSGGVDGLVRQWDPATGQERAWPWEPMTYFSALALSPDGTTVACGGYDSAIRLFDAATQQQHGTLRGHTAPPWSLAFAPDGKTLASAAGDGTSRLWDTERQQETVRRQHAARVAFRPDGNAWVAGDTWGPEPFKVWDATTGEEGPSLDMAGLRLASCFAVSPDSTTLATGCWDQPVILWDLATGKRKRQFTSVPALHRAFALAFSPDGRTLALGSVPAFDAEPGNWPSAPLTLWDVATGEPRVRMQESTDLVISMAFRPDGRVLATGGQAEGSVSLWNAQTGARLRTYALGPPKGLIRDLAFTPDGRRLFVLDGNGTVSILRVAP